LTIEAQMRQNGFPSHSDVWITFRDTGIGIPDNVLKNIFEPFFTTKQEGTGLGLAIAKRIIEAHNGRIEVSANTPQGTIFTVCLPVDLSATTNTVQNITIMEKNK
jgi:signal transduction histidine kinase